MEEHRMFEPSEVNTVIREVTPILISCLNAYISKFKYLSWDDQEVDIDHIAAYLRHNLECMPR